jgi:hypothetical protein
LPGQARVMPQAADSCTRNLLPVGLT